MPKKPATQLELFAGHGDDPHALGLLGWRDPLWTRRFEIPLMGGSTLPMTLASLRQAAHQKNGRQLHSIARQAPASGAATKPKA